MPVRGTTEWRHARVGKKIINHDSGDGRKVICAWDTCERPGLSIYEVRVHQHADAYKNTDERYMHYPFCSENHKQYWLASLIPGNNNNLPPGYRLV
jgi:hypothetical protein